MPNAPRQPRTFNILVVDDEPAVLRILRMLLAGAGYACFEARRAEDALEMVVSARNRIDLVLIDFHLPDLGAHELARRLREVAPGTRVLFMASLPGQGTYSGSGPDDVPIVPKPLAAGGLLRAIHIELAQAKN